MSKVNILTPKDVCEMFDIGKNQAYALMNSEGFPSIRLNRKIYVEEDALREWLDSIRGRKYAF